MTKTQNDLHTLSHTLKELGKDIMDYIFEDPKNFILGRFKMFALIILIYNLIVL